MRTRKAKWLLRALCLPLLSLCAPLAGQEQPIVSAEQRASPAPPGTVTPAPDLLSIPQPNLSGVEGSVKVQIEAAWAELQALLQKPGIRKEDLAEACGQIGKIYHAYDFSEGAAACYQNAHSLAPAEFSWPYYLGRLYQEQGQIKNAVTFLKIAQELRPNEISVLVYLAEAYLADSQSEPAKALYEKALALESSAAAAMAGLGRIALSHGDFRTAIASLEAALKLQPEATSLHYALAMAYRGVRDVANALAHLREQGPGKPKVPDPLMDDLEELKKGGVILWRRGNQAMHEGRYADAVRLYDQMVSLAKEDPLPKIYLGNALAAEGNLKDAIEQYRQVLRLRPKNATAHYNLGVTLLQLSSEQEAIEHFRAAVASDPDLKLAHFQLANLLMRGTRYQEAIPHYTRVIELSPENEFARLMKSMAFIRLRQYAAAKAELEESVASLPENTDLVSGLARLLAACPDKSIRDGSRALRLIEKLLTAHPSPDLELVETYAMALAAVGRLREAADLQRRMIATVEEAGRHDIAAVLKKNLSLYETGKACSLPWRDDDPIFVPQPGEMRLIIPDQGLGMAKGGSILP